MGRGYLAVIFVAACMVFPLLGEAQTAGANPQPSLPVSDVVNLVNEITSKVVQGGQALQNLAGSATGIPQTVTTQTNQTVGSQTDISGLVNLWNNVNNWFTQNIGTSLASIVQTVINFMIYIWEIIIKLLQVLVAHL